MRDVEVEAAVAIGVEEAGARRPAAVVAQAELLRALGEARDPVDHAVVAVEEAALEPGDEEILIAVVVEVGRGRADAVGAGLAEDSGRARDVRELQHVSPAPPREVVAEERVAGERRVGLQVAPGAAGREEDVEVAVLIGVEEDHAAGHLVGDAVLVRRRAHVRSSRRTAPASR